MRLASARNGCLFAAVVALAVGSPSCEAPSEKAPVQPAHETDPVPHDGDAADDAAIWVNEANPRGSTIIGTDKKGGLGVYELDGPEIQFLADGRMNNVDLRPGFRIDGRRTALVVAGNRTDDSLAIYRVEPRTRRLVDAGAGTSVRLSMNGTCMYHSAVTGDFYAFVTSTTGRVQQWRLFERAGRVGGTRVRAFEVGSRAEACVADDALGELYVADEVRGIWKYSAEPAGGTRRALVDSTGSKGHLVADVEGLALAESSKRRGYLVASSQGNDSFVVYERSGRNRYVSTFEIASAGRIDGVEDTDGIDVTLANLGAPFEEGMFVAQDGRNAGERQNFKMVPWSSIAAGIE